MTEMYAGNNGNTVSQQVTSKNDDQPAVINASASALAADGSTVWVSSLLPCKHKILHKPHTHTYIHIDSRFTMHLTFLVNMLKCPKLTHQSKKAKLQVT